MQSGVQPPVLAMLTTCPADSSVADRGRGQVVDAVDLSRLQSADLGRFLVDVDRPDFVEVRLRVVPVFVELDGDAFAPGREGLELERAAADRLLRVVADRDDVQGFEAGGDRFGEERVRAA